MMPSEHISVMAVAPIGTIRKSRYHLKTEKQYISDYCPKAIIVKSCEHLTIIANRK